SVAVLGSTLPAPGSVDPRTATETPAGGDAAATNPPASDPALVEAGGAAAPPPGESNSPGTEGIELARRDGTGLLPQTMAVARQNPWSTAAIVAGLGAALAGTVVVFRRENARYTLVAPLLGLYTRLKRPEVLGHAAREALQAAIRESPGIHYSALQERTGLNTGALVYHLRTLEKHRVIVSRREGPNRRFYPVEQSAPRFVGEPLTPAQEDILRLLARGPMTQSAIAHELHLTKQGVNYHVKNLERKGYLALEFRDGEWVCVTTTPAHGGEGVTERGLN
ncbi:MAG TPA: MarR family transcriptional regulator, partial [Candidatus Thermoplasmatota archaeon]|nr:MarR family transcriptional regulator [Candidatus Thermoplasmatota archaeon]